MRRRMGGLGIALLLSLSSGPAHGMCKHFWPSVVIGSAAQAVDIVSSRGRYELNPVLGRGTFGTRQAAMKASVYVGINALVWRAVRRDGKACRVASYVNYGAAGLTFGVSIRNRR